MRIFSMTSVLSLMFAVSVFAQTLESEFEPVDENQQVNLNLSVQESSAMNANISEIKREIVGHFDRTKRIGTGLVIGGAVLGTTGVVLGTVSIVDAIKHSSFDDLDWYFEYNGKTYYDEKEVEEAIRNYVGGAVAKSVVCYLVGAIGYSTMTIGIPIRNAGKEKGAYWRNKIPSTAYIVPNGVNMVWNF